MSALPASDDRSQETAPHPETPIVRHLASVHQAFSHVESVTRLEVAAGARSSAEARLPARACRIVRRDCASGRSAALPVVPTVADFAYGL